MKKFIAASAFLFLALAFFSPAKSFASMPDIGAAELAKEAKVIVQGEVKKVKSYKGLSGVIYTRASVLVSDIIKGKIAKKNITVEYKGGEVGNIGLSVEDEPLLEKGERVILFLTNSFWRKNVYYVVGGVLGKYAICPDDTVRIGYSCDEDESDEIVADEEIRIPEEETQDTETFNNVSFNQEKQTLDELLNEIMSH